MAYDDDEDWDMLGEDSQLKGEDAAGWGVDSSLYTTNLSGVSSDLREKAKAMARQMMGEKKGGARRQMSNVPVPSYVVCVCVLSLLSKDLTTRKHVQYSDAEQRRRVERYLRGRRDENACTSTQEAATTTKETRNVDKRQ